MLQLQLVVVLYKSMMIISRVLVVVVAGLVGKLPVIMHRLLCLYKSVCVPHDPYIGQRGRRCNFHSMHTNCIQIYHRIVLLSSGMH